MGCIYLVTNLVNGKQYVGKTVNGLKKRKHEHEADSRKGCKWPFQRALRKYGFDSFEWDEVYSDAKPEDLDSLEIECISWFGTLSPKGYNMTSGGSGPAVVSKETRLKISRAGLGRKHSLESKRKIGEANKQRKWSLKARAKISNSNFGHIHTEDTKRRMSKCHKGIKFTEEHKRKIGKSKLGKPRSEETKQKIREKLQGCTLSDDTKLKISQACSGSKNGMYGRRHSEATRLKISQALKSRATVRALP